MNNNIFMCFAAEDRYRIVESLVYHLKNYGIGVWYDRYSLVLGDDRVKKNLLEGAASCKYATVVISEYTIDSVCAMEELSIIKARYQRGELTVFPVLYEISPNSLSHELCWIKELIFKETNKQSGTYEICNHIACKVTNDILEVYTYKNIPSIICKLNSSLPPTTFKFLTIYQELDASNLNSRVSILYAAYITLTVDTPLSSSEQCILIEHIFERLFSETKLHLAIDYRDLWLLENSICILVNLYLTHFIESSI